MTEHNPAEHDRLHQRPVVKPARAVATPDGLVHEQHYSRWAGWSLRCGRDNYRSLTDLGMLADDGDTPADVALTCGGCRSYAVRFRGTEPTDASRAWDRERLR